MSDDYPGTRPNWLSHDTTHPEAQHIGLGIYAVPLLRGQFPAEQGMVTLELVLQNNRYVVHKFSLQRHKAEDPTITSELLRKVRVQELVTREVPEAVRVYEAGSDVHRSASLSDDEKKLLLSAGPVDDTLKWVGRLHLLGQLLGTGPAKYVRESLGLPASTAGNWIRRAKDRGFLHG